MRIFSLVAASAVLTLASCTQFEVTGQAGYAQLSLDGDFGYLDGTGTAAVQQDVQSAFGLGDDQGSPYARVAFDFGVPTLSASGFIFSDEGSGTLTADFGSNLLAGTLVNSEFDLACARIAYAFEIGLGPVSLSPGIAAEYVDLGFTVSDAIGIATEDVQVSAPVPMAFLRGEVDLGVVTAVAEGGLLSLEIDDVDAQLLDLEAMLEVNISGGLHAFAGYRFLNLQAEGIIDDDAYDIDLGLSGFVLGGGFRF